jgi:hypothetical protein
MYTTLLLTLSRNVIGYEKMFWAENNPQNPAIPATP